MNRSTSNLVDAFVMGFLWLGNLNIILLHVSGYHDSWLLFNGQRTSFKIPHEVSRTLAALCVLSCHTEAFDEWLKILPHFVQFMYLYNHIWFNSLWPSDAIRRQWTESTLAQVMACCLKAPSHYLNQYWLIISEAQWHSYAIWREMPQTSIIKISL